MAEVVLSEKKPLSRSEREASIKDKAGWLITVTCQQLFCSLSQKNNKIPL